jgi:predicted nucleic acid-binding protein
MIILDTNVLSEVMKPAPAERVLYWMANQQASALFITATTLAELLYGIELKPMGKSRTALNAIMESILEQNFLDRILPFDADAARTFALIMSARRKSGRPMAQMDGQIAAIARSRGAQVATRDTPGFELCGVTLIDPWAAVTIQ